MLGILDRVAAQQHSAFHPQTIREFFSLCLAQKLGEPEAARHYLELADQHSEEGLLVAYRRAAACSGQPGSLARNFHSALKHGTGNGPQSRSDRLLAIKVERRSVAVAFLIGTQLDYTQIHHLPSARDKAGQSAFGFANSMISHLKVESAAFERLEPKHEIRRLFVGETVETALTSLGLPVWTADKKAVLSSFGHPAPHSRNEVRKAVSAIWPVLGSSVGILDAVALGLHVQTERLFSYEY